LHTIPSLPPPCPVKLVRALIVHGNLLTLTSSRLKRERRVRGGSSVEVGCFLPIRHVPTGFSVVFSFATIQFNRLGPTIVCRSPLTPRPPFYPLSCDLIPTLSDLPKNTLVPAYRDQDG
jgi:hypothetical protein